MRRFVSVGASLVAVVAAALPLSSGAAQQMPTDTEIRAMLLRRVAQGKNPGVVVGIYENGATRIIEMGRSSAPNDSLDGNTVFEIGSITKVFTSTLLADMAARHLVALDDPVARYLPATVRVPSRNGRSITLLDLATQHSAFLACPTT